MKIGKMYYLATILNNLNIAAWIILCGLMGFIVIYASVFFADYYLPDDLEKLKKQLKLPLITLIISLIVLIFTPSKEDFLIIAMTKDYKPEQVYKMTKDEIKNSIDYLFEQIKEIKE